jgi:serine phosphatase RsbU (regulator of sigma subunit)
MRAFSMRGPFDRLQLALLDELTDELIPSLQVAERAETIVKFLARHVAQRAELYALDHRGTIGNIASSGTPAAPAHQRIELPLTAAGHNLGKIGLSGVRTDGVASNEFLAHLARRCAQSLHNARLFEREQFVSLTFQNEAVAVDLPRVPGIRFEAIYEAGSAEALVGGDWYDAFPLSDGRVVVSIGDVAGSGLYAAVTMVNVRQTLRGVAYVHADPVLMLQAAEATLRSQ